MPYFAFSVYILSYVLKVQNIYRVSRHIFTFFNTCRLSINFIFMSYYRTIFDFPLRVWCNNNKLWLIISSDLIRYDYIYNLILNKRCVIIIWQYYYISANCTKIWNQKLYLIWNRPWFFGNTKIIMVLIFGLQYNILDNSTMISSSNWYGVFLSIW